MLSCARVHATDLFPHRPLPVGAAALPAPRLAADRLFAAALLVCAAALGAPLAAAAQRAPSANEVALARQQFDLGLRAAREDRWADALAAFERSYELAPRPVTLLNLAGAQIRTGKLVAGTESYRRFLATAGERDAERYRAQVEQAVAAAEARIGRAELRIRGLAPNDEVALDGVTLSRASLQMALPVDPGEHVVVVTRGDREVARAAFVVQDGQSTAVRVEVRDATVPTPDQVARAGGGPAAVGGVDADAHDEARGDDAAGRGRSDADDRGGGIFASPWFWILTGVVVVGAVTATVLLATSGSPDAPFQGSLMPGAIVVE